MKTISLRSGVILWSVLGLLHEKGADILDAQSETG